MTMEDETVINGGDDFYVWRASKPGATLIGTYIGRILLTDRRLLFVSSGTSGVGKAALATLIGGPIAGATIGRTSTAGLDETALDNEGSLSIPLARLKSTLVKRRWDFSSYLTIETSGAKGLPAVCAFMTKMGWNRAWLESFRRDIDEAREKVLRRARPGQS
jgi:hypothetical protein